MPDDLAISIKNLNKNYRLYPSVVSLGLDVLGLTKLMFWKQQIFAEHQALIDVSLEVKKGERVGIVGRNGAGKSTLLKLVTGNFAPTSGDVNVSGKVQALMSVGLGFHSEFSGLENIRSSLTYNGIPSDRLDDAIQDVVDFAELEEYLNQPMKTYSLGMQARLMFGAATAITPDILIVDEVMGAGDGYFSAKSANRMKKLTDSGCSLLLVSHSTQQILQFCERAIWIESGAIIMDASALAVVKAYEEYTQKLNYEAKEKDHTLGSPSNKKSIIHNAELREIILKEVLGNSTVGNGDDDETAGNIVSDGGISRWRGEGGLLLSSIELLNADGELTHFVRTGEATSIDIEVVAETSGKYPCIFALVLYSADGETICRSISDPYTYDLEKGEKRKVRLEYPEILLGNGTFTISASIHSVLDLHDTSTAKAYDLLSRSFQFDVVEPYRDDSSLLHPPSVWTTLE